MFADPLTAKLSAFVRAIGIEVHTATLDGPVFFPGVDIQYGGVLIDEARLAHPADILHEAGHIAVTDPAERFRFRLTPNGGEEMATLAWPYAGALHLEGAGGGAVPSGSAQRLVTGADREFRRRTVCRRAAAAMVRHDGRTTSCGGARSKTLPHMLRWAR